MGPDVSPRPTVCAVTADRACGPSPRQLPAPGGDQVNMEEPEGGAARLDTDRRRGWQYRHRWPEPGRDLA